MNTSEDYLKTLLNPDNWFEYYRRQKLIGDILYEKMLSKDEILKMKNDPDNSDFPTIFINAHYHWGIAIENGFKAIIIKHQPELADYEVRQNHVKLKSIGGNAGKTHNLLKLSETVGLFDENKVNVGQYNVESVKELLMHLSDMIKWGARYPVTNNTASVYRLTNRKVAHVQLYGFHILDLLDIIFKFIEEEMPKKQSSKNGENSL
jgi:hypothetical protein